ncbi:MAG: copper chaperone PCu(A)C, partial [Thalassobaculaceae bacterium]|nr:copper chaperone PCu(A)C [Thalassobaculaceae bacterium]
NGAAYLTIRNAGGSVDRLVAASTPVADRAELHTHLKDGDVMKMRAIEAVEVPADGMAMLAPGGDHLMLMGLKAPLKEGESFPITLVFEKAGEMTVTVAVGGVGAMEGQSGSGHHGSHDMKKKSN